jgi:hypothetical protein
VAGVKGRSGGPRKNAGGARPGAGRKPNPAPPAPPPPKDADVFNAMLAAAREYAEAGVEEPTILAVLGSRFGFDEARLKAEGRLATFRQTVALGLEVCRADLIVSTKRRATKTKKNDGSVNAMALRARNLLGWDRQSIQDEQKPDLTGARERLRFMLEKLARNKAAELGREVSPQQILLEDLYEGTA